MAADDAEGVRAGEEASHWAAAGEAGGALDRWSTKRLSWITAR